MSAQTAEPPRDDRPAATTDSASTTPPAFPVHGGGADPSPAPRIDPHLVSFLVCPVTRHQLVYDDERAELVSKAARLAFPIREGVALLTLEASRPLTDDELRRR